MDTWQNGCMGKLDNPPVHTTPNHHPTKMDILPKAFFQIILVGNWLGRHPRTSSSPNQQRRPLSSLLSDSYSMIIALVKAEQLRACIEKLDCQELVSLTKKLFNYLFWLNSLYNVHTYSNVFIFFSQHVCDLLHDLKFKKNIQKKKQKKKNIYYTHGFLHL